MNAGQRLLDVLETFDLEHRALTVSEIAQRLGQPQSSVYRSVRTLKDAGYLAAGEDGVYRLQPKLLRLAAVVRADNDVLRCARTPMLRLAHQTRQSSMLAVVSDRYAVCVDSVGSGRPIGVTVPPGKLFPLHAGASARVLLANLPEIERRRRYAEYPPESFTDETTTDIDRLEAELAVIRDRGYDLTAEQFEPGIFACAVPVHDADGFVVASLSVVGVVESVEVEGGVESLLPDLKAAAAAISELL